MQKTKNQNLNIFWSNIQRSNLQKSNRSLHKGLTKRWRALWLIMGCCGCLTFVGHEIWRVLKFILAALAFVGAVVTFFNIICNIYILREVVAAVLAVSALFMMIDSVGIEAVLNQFRFEIHRLGDEVDRLQDVEQELKQTSHELSQQLQQGANLLAQEKTLTEEYAQKNEEYAQKNVEYAKQNEEYIKNNAQLSTELAKLQDQNRMLDATMKAQQIQIQRLVLIEQNAERMISSLMQAGDNFDHFGEILSKSVKEMEDTNTAMERLLKELAKDKFQTIDENRDGVITQQELEDYARRREPDPDEDFHY